MHVGGFPGASRPFPGSRGLHKFQGLAKPAKNRGVRQSRVMRDGQAGLGHPPCGGGGSGEGGVQGREEGAFLKGSERPEAGCLSELKP